MRTLCVAVTLLMSAQVASASARGGFWDELARLDVDASLIAYRYLECTDEATKGTASSDTVTPSKLMADWAASEAAKQCASRGRALIPSVGWIKATMLKAMARRVNKETALQVRHGEPKVLCAVEWRGCSMK